MSSNARIKHGLRRNISSNQTSRAMSGGRPKSNGPEDRLSLAKVGTGTGGVLWRYRRAREGYGVNKGNLAALDGVFGSVKLCGEITV